ncbi:DUF6377 domain-containing protein [Mariniflexile aquimaris]|uniref:DUF6377 domain-containing protein n=1 Tax=Mariniflexile aquimaris TaxID=881009 RepID=A0ABW3BUB0_9FLAO
MKPITTILLLCAFMTVKSQNNLLDDLKSAIDSSYIYDNQKHKEILSIKKALIKLNESDFENKFNLNQQLFDQYKVFKSDSAYYFSLQNKTIAEKLKDSSLISRAFLNMSDICVSVGMYKEAMEYLQKIDAKFLNNDVKTMYFGIYGRFYSDLAEYSNLPDYSFDYNQLAKFYREKTLELIKEGGFFNNFMVAYNEYKAGDQYSAITKLDSLLEMDLGLHDQALTHYVLGEIYYSKDIDKAEYHYSKAAIADIKTSTKESLAIIRLSEILFKKKNLEMASLLIQKAYQDAKFYGAQQRKLQVGAILPLVQEGITQNIEQERKRLYIQYVGVIISLIIVIIFMTIVIIQFKRLQKAKKLITHAHNELQNINIQLTQVNEQVKVQNQEIKDVNERLFEANKIKEDYLGFFFTEYDNVFEKFNDFISVIDNNIDEKNIEKLKYHLSKYNLKKEKEKLLDNFDNAFINLFPNFINEFNALMKEGHKIKLKENQILNKELRIFALIRLGITHNDVIAQILGYSVNSIYAYKTKIRNRSLIENDSFDQNLLNNTSIRI